MIKKILITILVLISFDTFSQSEFDKVSNCYFSKSKNGNELIKEIIKFENFLISKKILNNNSGKSYYELFKRISYNGEETSFNYLFSDSINKLQLESIKECNNINTELLNNKNSKAYKLKEALASLENETDISPKNIAEKLLPILEPSDFNNYVQKLKTLLLVDNFNITNSEIFNIDTNENINENSKFLLIKIDKLNRIFINESEFKLDNDFEKIITDYLKHENHFIELRTDTKTSYSKYINVINELDKIELKLKNKFSLEKYGKEINDLNYKQKQQLEKEFGNRIKT